ncbi:MAG: glycogen synthase [Anaerolineae bacterium]|nr:glycogen synthase [Anaerolineae bacterium]MDW8068235.1 glycogen synthase [Anaerolineae bacterium]
MSDQGLKVLFLAAEAVPFAKVGGLADVAGALPQALRALGHDVRLMMPRYGSIRSDQFHFERVGKPFPVPVGAREEMVHMVTTTVGDLPVYLLWDEKFFSPRDRIYGFDDDPQRFTFFSRAVIASLPIMGWMPDIIHANDWHTAPVPTWLAYEGRHQRGYRSIASVFTIHNIAYQGLCGRLILTFARMEYVKHLDVEPAGQVNWMAQGIASADMITTVSPQYARDILETEAGAGLSPLLRRRQDRLVGILNGIDTDYWNPASDPYLRQWYDIRRLRLRTVNKAALQQEARLPVRPETPLVGMVTRLDAIKGIDLLEPVLDQLLQGDVQFVLLGTGDPEYHQKMESLQARFPDKVRVFLRYDEPLAHRIYAGCDLFLMPSRFEPCGLSQMIAMHYGAVPVVHRTGGLADTVLDYHEHPDRATGFVFDAYTPEACGEALERALRVYRDRTAWTAIQTRGMKADFSWKGSAQKYVDIYRRALELHGKA